MPLDDTLVVHTDLADDRDELGLSEGDRLVEVNGTAVTTTSDLAIAQQHSAGRQVLLKFVSSANDHHVISIIWQELLKHPAFEFGPSATLISAPGLPESHKGALVSAISGHPVSSIDEINKVFGEIGLGSPGLLLRGTKNGDGDLVLSYTVVDLYRYFTSLIVGFAIASCAIAVFWVRGWSIGAGAFVWFATNLAMFTVARSIPFDYRWEIEQIAYLLCQVCLPLSAIVFLFNMTPLRNFAYNPIGLRGTALILIFGVIPAFFAYKAALNDAQEVRDRALLTALWLWLVPPIVVHAADRVWRILGTSAMPAYLSYGCGVSIALVSGGWLSRAQEINRGLLPDPEFIAWELWMLAIVVVGLVSEVPLMLMKIPLSSLDRQRAHLLRLACLCSFLPMSIYTLIDSSEIHSDIQTRLLVELAQVAFPALLAVGIIRQNVLHLSRLVREAMVVMGMLIAAIVGYAILWAVIMPTLSDMFEAPYAVYSAAFTILLVGLFTLVYFLLNRYANKGRFRSGVYEQDFLLRLHEQTVKAESVNNIHDFISSEFSEHLQVARTHLILDSCELSSAAGGTSEATTVWTPESKAAGELLEHMQSSESTVYTSDLEEQATQAPVGILDALHEIGVSVGIPLRNNGRLIGAMLVGRENRGPNFTGLEVSFLTQAARHLGVSLRAASQSASKPSSRIVDLFPSFPKEIAGYRIQRTLGQGGTSFVYLGTKNNRPAAVKVANHSVQANSSLRSRFEREAKILRELRHTHIVEMLEYGHAGDEPYLAVEYVQGGSLRERLEREGPLNDAFVANVLCQAADALEFAADKRIIHRDIKPGNLYITPSGVVKLADFGSGRMEDDDLFTFTGERLGTLAYMSPESLIGEDLDWRSDQYALGVSAFELLVGHRPFEGRSPGAQIAAKRANPSILMKPLAARIGTEFASVILTMIAPRAEHRFKSYEELRDKLTELFGALLESPAIHSESALPMSGRPD